MFRNKKQNTKQMLSTTNTSQILSQKIYGSRVPPPPPPKKNLSRESENADQLCYQYKVIGSLTKRLSYITT